MWIMVAGPYRSGSNDPVVWAENLRVLNQAAHELFKLGHVPVIGVNLALPIIEAAGGDSYDEVMLPLSLSLAYRCDAVLRIGGPSTGAEAEVERFASTGRPVFRSLDEVASPNPDRWRFDWETASDDELIDPPLSREQRNLLSQGVWIWVGPTRATDDLARALGYGDKASLLRQCRDLAIRVRDGEPLTKSEWATALTSLEIAWASKYYGAGGEWDIVTPNAWSDEWTLATLRSIQRVFAGLRAPRQPDVRKR